MTHAFLERTHSRYATSVDGGIELASELGERPARSRSQQGSSGRREAVRRTASHGSHLKAAGKLQEMGISRKITFGPTSIRKPSQVYL